MECAPGYFSKVSESASFRSAGYSFDSHGRLIVKSHRDEIGDGSKVMGNRELPLDGLTVVGMYDLHSKALTFESYSWGLLVKGKPNDIVRRVNETIPSERFLERDWLGLGFARLDATTLSAWPKWSTSRPVPQPAPVKLGDIELVAEVSPADVASLPGISRIGCSIQGVFPPFVLKRRRPDIE